ncbi:hypothetical protein [Cellulomonas sp. S1-8]|uniref:hypothetical protein n=1 Tax=Cellulomonas sp. S1-8 TaxID=2904790 RepID=UPI00224422B2|nr:hypothetical protein [Cellulomonas sp. S1-8]UZN04073.1 hypothetical protein OKX07_03810 [Cellulomonas sp. S1-8]
MRARTTRTISRTAAAVATAGMVAVMIAGAPASAQVTPEPGPTIGPILPGPTLGWRVALRDTWTSPTWAQRAGRTTVTVHLDCGGAIGIRLPQYYVKVVAEGRIEPAVMPRPVPCGVTHTFTGNQPAGKYHLFLAKATSDAATLVGKAAVQTP